MKKSSKKVILITGGTGYLGNAIINGLIDTFNFVVLKRNNSNITRLQPILPSLQLYNIEDLTEQLLHELDIDIILHCATHYGRRDANPRDTIEANLMLPLHLISLFNKAGKSITFINTDTILDKNISVYSLSKNHFKDWMHFFGDRDRYINIQLEHFYGPLDDKTKFVSFLIDSFIKEIPQLDLTAGEQSRYFTYIDDVVSAFEFIINNTEHFSKGFTEFQVSSNEPINLKSFIGMVQHLSGNTTTTLNFGAIPYRKGEMMNFKVNNDAVRQLGWHPKISLEKGLRKTIEIDKQHL